MFRIAGVRPSVGQFPALRRSLMHTIPRRPSSEAIRRNSSTPVPARIPFFGFKPSPFRPSSVPTAYARSYCSTQQFSADKIRNIAVIAHVDHGKTTLLDCILKQTDSLTTATHERAMDSNDLEREKGITIISKCCSVVWKDHKINLVDTPGHGDFGGEVERVLSMVDGVIVLVDAAEGVMVQTKFVLSKAIQQGLKCIVVMNKMDRFTGNLDEVEAEIFDLFCNLDESGNALEYPTLYGSAKNGWVSTDPKAGESTEEKNMEPLLDTMLSHISAPEVNSEVEVPFKMLVSTLERHSFFGRLLTGRVLSGEARPGDKVHAISLEGKEVEEGTLLRVLERRGMSQEEVPVARAGDIVSLAGFTNASVAHTVCPPDVFDPIESIPIDPPVISMTFGVNDSPIAGRDGTHMNGPVIQARLAKELEGNVSLQIKKTDVDSVLEVWGRGELQMAVLVETMRREGFELNLGPPKVIMKTIDGVTMEPMEEVVVNIHEKYMGNTIEKLSKRQAEMTDMKRSGDDVRLTFLAPARALIGFMNEFQTDTKGSGDLNHTFHSYARYKGKLNKNEKGALIAKNAGKTTAYALTSLEARGVLYVPAGVEVYEGMIIGENSRPGDLYVNCVKEKHLTNIRAAGKEDALVLTPYKKFSLEQAIATIREDEIIEVTPKAIRFRKKILGESERRSAIKRGKNA